MGVAYDVFVGAVFELAGHFSIGYQREAKGTALALVAFDPDVTAVGRNNSLG